MNKSINVYIYIYEMMFSFRDDWWIWWWFRFLLTFWVKTMVDLFASKQLCDSYGRWHFWRWSGRFSRSDQIDFNPWNEVAYRVAFFETNPNPWCERIVFLGVGVVMCHFCVAWGSHSPQSNMAGWQIHETKNSIVPRRTPHCCQPGHIIRQNQTISEAVPTCRNKIDQQTTQKKTAPVSAWRYPTRFRTLGFSENPHRAPGCLCPVLQVSTTGKSWLRCTGRRNSLPNCGSIKAIHKDGNRSFCNIKKNVILAKFVCLVKWVCVSMLGLGTWEQLLGMNFPAGFLGFNRLI